MSSNSPDSRQVLNANLREAFGRVVYAHKTHEKAREIESARASRVKWINIVLVTLTSAGLLSTIITNARALLYVSSALSALALAFVIFQFSFDPAGEGDKHRRAAKELWLPREEYVNLLADLHRGMPEDEVARKRDELTEQLNEIYAHAPDTSGKAYAKAQKALKVNEDMTFSVAEINKFLPKELHDPE
jgi:hypothetical protein